ncbi:MAG: hypothetical protein Q9182_004390 [Xanthomendoza sp. 2 TL-2023]
MDAPRLIVLIFLLLILFASPNTQLPSPSQRRELDFQVAQERHALAFLSTPSYGDFDAAGNKWINVTGLRKEDGYAWDLLPRVQERARQQASMLVDTWHRLREVRYIESTNDTSIRHNLVSTVPFYRNITGLVHGYWARSEVGKQNLSPVLNLTALAPRMAYATAKYTWNVTGTTGEILFRLDEKQSEMLELRDTSVREITAKLTVEDELSGGDGWQITLHGIHHPRDGSIMLTTTGPRFAGIFALPYFALSKESFFATQQLLNRTLNAAVKTQEGASQTDALGPWSSSPQTPSDLAMPTPHCEYLVYLQQHPIDTRATDVEPIETELRYPTGRLDITAPPIRMSAVLFSPDCGFVIESKGPPEFALQYGNHLKGPKLETYDRSSRRIVFASALLFCAEIYLLMDQIRDASTPSTRSRVSFYTIGIMAIGDGFVCVALVFIGVDYDAVSLPAIATAFLALFSLIFLGMRFMVDVWTVQYPERDERRRQQQSHTAATTTTPLLRIAATTAAVPTAGADTLPLPVTAARPTSSSTPGSTLEEGQESLVGNQSPTTAITLPSPLETVQINAAGREVSGLQSRFCLVLGALLFVTLYSWTLPLLVRTTYSRSLSVVYLSFYVPQICRNIKRNCRKALRWRFVAGQAALRICPFAYYYLHDDNHLSFMRVDSNWIIALLAWLWFQICILLGQELFGPRFFVPQACTGWMPAAYDYHPILREEDEESCSSMPIGLTQPTASLLEDISASSITEDRSGSQNGDANRKIKKVFDCAICMQRLEVPVALRDKESKSVGTAAAGIGVGVKDLVFGRRAYMVTPSQRLSDRLPNPFRIPDSQIALKFIDRLTGPVFFRREMVTLLDKARQDVLADLERDGNIPIPPGTHQIKSGEHTFVYESHPDHSTRVMKYNEVLTVIRGFNEKARVDQTRYRFATVLFIQRNGGEVETGDAAILKRAPSVPDDVM